MGTMTGSWVKNSIISFGLVLLLFSCIDESYDLRSISKDFSLGGDQLALPIGNTDSIYLVKLLGDSTGDIDYNNMIFNFNMESEIDTISMHFESFYLPDLSVDLSETGVEATNRTPDSVYAQIDYSTELEFEESVPDELVSVLEIKCDEHSVYNLEIQLEFENVPSGLDQLSFSSLNIQFPEFLRFKELEPVRQQSLILNNETFNPQNGYSTNLTLSGFDYSGWNNGDGIPTIKEDDKTLIRIDQNNTVSFKGTLVTSHSNLSDDELSNIRVIPHFRFDSVLVEELTGKYLTSFDTLDQSFEFDSKAASLMQGNFNIDVSNPLIYVDFATTASFPVQLRAKIYGLDEFEHTISGSEIPEQIITLSPATNYGEIKETHVLFSALGNEVEGYKAIQIEELSNLFKIFPAKIALIIEPYLDASENCNIRTNYQYVASGHAKIEFPVQLNNLNIYFNDTLTGLSENLSGLGNIINELDMRITMNVENSFPFELGLNLYPIDSLGAQFEGVTTDVEGKIPSGNGLNASREEINFHLAFEEDRLRLMDGLLLNIHVQTIQTAEGTTLDSTQFIRFSAITLLFNGGVNFNLNDLNTDENDDEAAE